MIEEFVGKMKKIQSSLLEYLDDEVKFEDLIKVITDQRINENKHKFKLLLRLITIIGNDHQRVPNFFSKIEQILKHFQKDIQKHFQNSEIFQIFGKNKRLLLSLVEEKIITVDEYFFSQITNNNYVKYNYCEYFQPEIKPFLTKDTIEKYQNENTSLKDDKFIEELKKEVPDDFYAKSREGENDDYLYQLVRSNKIDEFITFSEQTNLSFEIFMKKSIFETNPFLLDKSYIKLIEYASFYGSYDIIKYMQMKGVELTADMWKYAIHSRNAELIRLLDENRDFDVSESIISESIKCHHNDISNYLINNLIKEEDLQDDIKNNCFCNLYKFAVENDNYCFFPEDMKYKNMFHYLCHYDYYALVKLYLEEGNIDINATIETFIFKYSFKLKKKNL